MGFGIYDGVTGLVTQPVEGARQEGTLGFAKGLGKGLGGAMIKPIAGNFHSCTDEAIVLTLSPRWLGYFRVYL